MEKFRFVKSLKAQIGIVLAVQLVLFSAIISITLYELNLRKHDYIILNLAGQLRVISQSMANQSHIYLEQDKFTKASAPYNSAVFKTELLALISDYNIIIKSFRERQLSPQLTGRDDPLYCSWDKRALDQLDVTSLSWTDFSSKLSNYLQNPAAKEELLKAANYILIRHGELLQVSTNLSRAFRLMMEDKLALIAMLNKISLALVTLVSLSLAFWLFMKVYRPLQRTVQGFEAVAKGDLEYTVPGTSDNEIGIMITSFNHLTQRLSALFKLSQRVHTATTPVENFAFIAEEFKTNLPFEWVGMMSIDDCQNMTRHHQFANGALMLPEKNCFHVCAPEILQAVKLNQPVIIPNIDNLDRQDEFVHALYNTGLRSLILLPLDLNKLPGAMLVFSSATPAIYTEQHIELLRNVALMLSRSFEKAQNIENLVEMRDHAVNASKAKSNFLASMSHELRTPLNAIIGFSEMLYEDAVKSGNNRYAEDLGHIQNAGKHLVSLISNILDLSKIEAEKMELHLEDIRISTILEQVTSTIKPLMAENNNMFYCNHPDDDVYLCIDQTKFRQILLNLLSNAAKFTKDGEISISCEKIRVNGKDYINLCIEDNGIGLTQAQIDRLFSRYTQAESSTSRNFGGSGLGLALSQQLCRLMGGDIQVQSTLGVGSRFNIQLPITVEVQQATGVVH